MKIRIGRRQIPKFTLSTSQRKQQRIDSHVPQARRGFDQRGPSRHPRRCHCWPAPIWQDDARAPRCHGGLRLPHARRSNHARSRTRRWRDDDDHRRVRCGYDATSHRHRSPLRRRLPDCRTSSARGSARRRNDPTLLRRSERDCRRGGRARLSLQALDARSAGGGLPQSHRGCTCDRPAARDPHARCRRGRGADTGRRARGRRGVSGDPALLHRRCGAGAPRCRGWGPDRRGTSSSTRRSHDLRRMVRPRGPIPERARDVGRPAATLAI